MSQPRIPSPVEWPDRKRRRRSGSGSGDGGEGGDDGGHEHRRRRGRRRRRGSSFDLGRYPWLQRGGRGRAKRAKGFRGLDTGSGSGRRRRSRRHRSRLRRVIWIGVFLFLAALGTATVDAYLQAYRTVDDLRSAADALAVAKSSLLKGHLPKGDAFGKAATEVQAIQDKIDGARFDFDLVGGIPFLGRPVVAVKKLASAMSSEALAATDAKDLLNTVTGGALQHQSQPAAPKKKCSELKTKAAKTACKHKKENPAGGGPPAGPQSPLFSNGQFNLTKIKALIPQFQRLVDHLHAAEAAVLAVPGAPFVQKATDLKDEIYGEVHSAALLGENALAGLKFLPTLLGDGQPRTYFVAFGDESYLRGGGGSTIGFSLLDATGGRLTITPAQEVFRVLDPQVTIPIPTPPGDWYLDELPLTKRLGNANWSPNFPSDGLAMAEMFKKVTKQDIAGLIQVDAPAVAAMIKATGPITTDLWPDPITSRNVSQVAYIDSHIQLNGAKRKQLLTQLVDSAWNRLANPPDANALLQSVVQLGRALTEKHVQVWLSDPKEQAFASKLRWTGQIDRSPGDYLMVAEDNLGTDALDYFVHQTIGHDVTVMPDGSLSVTTTVTMNVALPASDRVRPIIAKDGPTKKTMVNLYVPEGAQLKSVTQDQGGGNRFIDHQIRIHVEQGRGVFTANMQTPPNHPTSVIFEYTIPAALVKASGGDAYWLTMQVQPKMNFDTLRFTLHLPSGKTAQVRAPVVAKGSTITLTKAVQRDFTLRLALSG